MSENIENIENIDEDDYQIDQEITSPFSTKDISINNRVIALSSLVERLDSIFRGDRAF
jgi:hypothetical protein